MIRMKRVCFVAAVVITSMIVSAFGQTNPPTLTLMGNRFLTFNTIVRVRQIEVTRDVAHGPDESSVHTPAEARTFREAIETAWPGGRITWAFSWLALHDERDQYRALRDLVVSYQKKFGDEITFIPGAYFSNMYNTREQVNRDLHEGLKRVSEIVGDGYRPKSVVAGFLASDNLRYLAEKENIHVCQGNIWSQYAVDNGDGEGSICYPYYPSREHFCKPAQGKADLIDCVNLDGWTVDFLCARIPGGRKVNGERWRSRQGVGPIETLLDMETEKGTQAMLATTAAHFDDGFARNGFAWVTCGWEMSLVEARKIYGYGGKNGMEGLHLWLTEIRKRWPNAKLITQGEFGLLWREQFKDNQQLDYRFVQRGCGIRASESDKEISWFMNKDFRLAILRDWQTNAIGKVIDFTRYDLLASEPADPEPGKQSRNWSLMNRLNQKGVRPQDKPISLQELTPEEQALITRRYPALIGGITNEAVWRPLFNGKDLSGWTVQCKSNDQGKTFWRADAGAIVCDSLGRPDHDYCWLVSDKEYGDFELRLKFQAYTNSPGNSGIQFRSRYDKDDKGGWLNGPQVDIHPPASQSWRTGLIYDETRGEQRWVSPSLPNSRIGAEHKLAGHVFKYANDGDGWNDLLLIARGNHIKTVVNGVVCMDWDGTGTLDNAAHRAKNVGARGHFALQLHAKDQLLIRFKDIAIRELDNRDASGKAGADLVACVKAEIPIEWPGFMRQHDMTSNTLPRNWKEAPHFGNAMVGSMLYRVEDTLRLQIFRADVQDHRDDTWGWTAYSRPRLMIGHFSLHPVGKLTGCTWRKDLWNAEMTGTITTDKGEIKIRHLTHAVDMAIVTELTPSAGEKGFTWTWHPAPAKTTRSGYPTKQAAIAEFAKRYAPNYAATLKVWEPNPPGRLEQEGMKSIWIQDLLKGGQYATAWSEQSKGETRSLLVTIAKSYPEATAATRAKEDLNRFCGVVPSAWIQSHRAWWQAYYQQSYLTIPNKGLESLYWQTIYRYGCTSRTGRSMVDTSGLWFQGAQWPYITTDWNIQSAHWAVYTANRLEQGEEVVNRLHEGREALVQAVRPVEWQKDSAYLALAVAPDMRGARDEDMRYYHLLGNLPWTLHNAWMQYRYSMDDVLLRDKIYPILRRSMNLYLHIVEEGKDGKLHLPPSYSPESGLWQDCAFDLALFKWGCLTLLKASKRLGIEDPLIPRWRDVAMRLVEFPVCDKGFKQGSDKPLLEQHRHLSHLLMIYPLYVANIEQEGMREVLQKSMQQSLALNSSDHNAAMVQTHAVPIATALGEGEHALKGLAFHQADLLPNGLWACSGNPCIESTLSLANNIQEMLLQSWCDPAKEEPGAIRIFPALPAEWKEVEFRDLRAEGAFLVSSKRSGGVTQWVRIKSLAGEPCRVKPGFNGPAGVTGARGVILKQPSPGIYEIVLRKGEEVVLVPVQR